MNNTEKMICRHLQKDLKRAEKKVQTLEQHNPHHPAIEQWYERIATLSVVIEDIKYQKYKETVK